MKNLESHLNNSNVIGLELNVRSVVKICVRLNVVVSCLS